MNFEPWDTFDEACDGVENFYGLTSLAFGLSQSLLFTEKPDAEPSIPASVDTREGSYSVADERVQDASARFVGGCVPYAEYAEREGMSEDEVKRLAQLGNFGPVELHLEKDHLLLLWPASMIGLPEPS